MKNNPMMQRKEPEPTLTIDEGQLLKEDYF